MDIPSFVRENLTGKISRQYLNTAYITQQSNSEFPGLAPVACKNGRLAHHFSHEIRHLIPPYIGIVLYQCFLRQSKSQKVHGIHCVRLSQFWDVVSAGKKKHPLGENSTLIIFMDLKLKSRGGRRGKTQR
jgi:hypothetical protein